MADNDYIGNIINSNWNAYNSGFLRQTPSWMRGRMRSADPANLTRFRSPNAGIQQQWSGEEMRPITTRSVAGEVIGKLNKARSDWQDLKEASAQLQQQANVPQLPTAPLPSPSPNAQPYRPTVAPTLPTAPLPAPAPNAQPYQPTVAPKLPSSTLPPPPPNAQPFGAPPQNPAFPAPGTTPVRPPLTPQQQEVVSKFEEVRKNRPTAQVAPATERAPVDRSWLNPPMNTPVVTRKTPRDLSKFTPQQQQAIRGVGKVRQERRKAGREAQQEQAPASQPAKTRSNNRKSKGNDGSNIESSNFVPDFLK